jgi:large subunit ribosomal protein L4
MATIEIKDMKGKKVATAELADVVFGVTPNTHAVHLVVRSQMAARRSGTHSTKTRGQVSGGGAKPFRQKGTGRARPVPPGRRSGRAAEPCSARTRAAIRSECRTRS